MIAASVVAHITVARIRRNPLTSISLVLLMALTCLTAAAGVGSIVATVGATDRLFSEASAPDAVQMHVGHVDAQALDAFAAEQRGIIDHQVQSALQLDNADLILDGTADLAREGVMDLLLVTQNDRFDFLLGSAGDRISVGSGEIAVPSYYAEAYGLDVGDPVEIRAGGAIHSFTMTDIALDAQMGPSLVNSKRLVISPADWAILGPSLDREEIITFRLVEGSAEEFASAYRAAGLPSNGAAVDGSLLRLISTLTDGIVAALSILVSLVLLAITLLCMRTMILTALEEDARRLGLLRTLGFTHGAVSRALLAGYAVHSAAALLMGLIFAFPLIALLGSSRALPPTGSWGVETSVLVALAGAALIPLVVAAQLLRRVRHIPPLAALDGYRASGASPRRLRRFRSQVSAPIAVRLGLRGLSARPATALLLIVMVACASALALLPLRLTETIAAPRFVQQMGIGESDLRIFLPSASSADSVDAIDATLRADSEVTTFAMSSSYRSELSVVDGAAETVAIEVGDATRFPISYTSGEAPIEVGELALSTLAAEGLGVGVGDEVRLSLGAGVHLVTGLYHDITNGGRSGKTPAINAAGAVALWHVVSIDLREGVDLAAKAAQLARLYPDATVTELERFVQYTLGDTVERLRVASTVAWCAAVALIALVFALRGRLEMARDRHGLRVLRLLGWTAGELRSTLLFRTACVAAVGALFGVVAAEALGPSVLGAMLVSFGGGSGLLESPHLAAAMPVLSVAVAAPLATLIAATRLPAPRNES